MSIADANNPFANGLQIIIERKGFKQSFIAKKAGYTAQELSDMLNGRRLIKACDIPIIAYSVGIKIDDIYEAGKKEGD